MKKSEFQKFMGMFYLIIGAIILAALCSGVISLWAENWS